MPSWLFALSLASDVFDRCPLLSTRETAVNCYTAFELLVAMMNLIERLSVQFANNGDVELAKTLGQGTSVVQVSSALSQDNDDLASSEAQHQQKDASHRTASAPTCRTKAN